MCVWPKSQPNMMRYKKKRVLIKFCMGVKLNGCCCDLIRSDIQIKSKIPLIIPWELPIT